MELYCLLRNPTCSTPLSAAEAVSVVQGFRANPFWRIVDHVLDSNIMTSVWKAAGRVDFAYRRVFDARLAYILLHHGVDSFATHNLRDFQDYGFAKVWNPLT